MAKEIAIGKRAKISEAQQYMLLSVLAASIVLGAAISLIIHFVQQNQCRIFQKDAGKRDPLLLSPG